MAQTILLRGASQLLTLRGPLGARRGSALQDLGIIPDGSMLIRDGLVESVGPTRRIENLKAAKGALEIPAFGKVVMPGLIDASLHLSLRRSQSLHRLKRVTDFHDDSLNLFRSCLQHGTVTADVSASADARDFHSDIAVLRKLVRIGNNPVRMIRTWRVSAGKDMAEPPPPDEPRLTFNTLVRRRFIDSVSFASEPAEHFDRELVVAAQLAGLPVKLSWDGGPTSLLADWLERLNPQTMTCAQVLTAPEAAVVAQTRTVAIVRAGKDVFEGPKVSAGRDLVDAGAAVALSCGYDSTAAANPSMQMSIALAVARLGFTAEEAISAATVNAAAAAGCSDLTGTLESGKQADLLILNIPDYRELPSQYGMNHVAMVFRGGNIVLNRTRWRAPVDPTASRVRPQLR